MKQFIIDSWSVIMIQDKTPLKHIQNLMVRHMIFQILAWMWCIIFSLIVGSFIAFGISAAAHTLLLAGIFITYSTFKVAEKSSRGNTEYRGSE